MEHNEYVLHEVTIQVVAAHQPYGDDGERAGGPVHALEERQLKIVGPGDDYRPGSARRLLEFYLERAFGSWPKLAEYAPASIAETVSKDATYKIIKHEMHKLDAIVRYSDAYRAQF